MKKHWIAMVFNETINYDFIFTYEAWPHPADIFN